MSNAQSTHDLFSHPDEHRETTSALARDEQRSYTGLFLEPVDVPSQGTGETA